MEFTLPSETYEMGLLAKGLAIIIIIGILFLIIEFVELFKYFRRFRKQIASVLMPIYDNLKDGVLGFEDSAVESMPNISKMLFSNWRGKNSYSISLKIGEFVDSFGEEFFMRISKLRSWGFSIIGYSLIVSVMRTCNSIVMIQQNKDLSSSIRFLSYDFYETLIFLAISLAVGYAFFIVYHSFKRKFEIFRKKQKGLALKNTDLSAF